MEILKTAKFDSNINSQYWLNLLGIFHKFIFNSNFYLIKSSIIKNGEIIKNEKKG